MSDKITKHNRTVLAAMEIARSAVSKELHNPSGLTENAIDTYQVNQDAVEKELLVIISYLFRRAVNNKSTEFRRLQKEQS